MRVFSGVSRVLSSAVGGRDLTVILVVLCHTSHLPAWAVPCKALMAAWPGGKLKACLLTLPPQLWAVSRLFSTRNVGAGPLCQVLVD